eukprot:jgi/Bigna1/85349/estExt_fgenesh1_pg.C_30315
MPAEETKKGVKRPAKTTPNNKSKPKRSKTKKGKEKKSGPGSQPTVKDILNDRLTPLANAYWALGQKSLRPYDAKVVEQIYKTELSGSDLKKINSRAVLLEFSSYLENYLWKNLDPKTSTFSHIMSIVMMVNEKFRENVPIWDVFHARNEEHIVPFFARVFGLGSEKEMTLVEKISQVLFLINCYSSLEDQKVRSCCMKYISLPMWKHLSKTRLRENFHRTPKLQAVWKVIESKHTAAESDFFPNLMKDFFSYLEKPKLVHLELKYVLRCMEFFVDLLSRLPTRRFFRPLVVDCHFVVRCNLSNVFKSPKGKLLRQLLNMIIFYEAFNIDDSEGKALTEKEIEVRRHERIERLQGMAFKFFRKEMSSLVLGSVSSMDTRENILKHLEKLSLPRLRELCERVGILSSKDDTSFLEVPENKKFLSEIFVTSFEKRRSQRQEVSALPLYPSEEVLWDMNLVPELNYQGDEVLALPKLNLQFLTIYDYLLRNFNLFRLESTYEIREDLKNVVHRLKPRLAGNGETVFTGWAKMAVPIKEFSITKVQKPKIGEVKPALVQAEVTVDLAPFQTYVRQDWEAIREHDVLFLLSIEAKYGLEEKIAKKKSMKQRLDPKELGIKYVRGCEVRIVLDEEKSMIGERKKDGTLREGVGDLRTYKVEMDTAQYQMDMTAVVDGKDDVNQTFNLLVKRKAKENNFKAVLATIRNLMAGQFVIPEWLHDVFLGYGDPGSATYRSVASPTWDLKFADSFLSFKHLKSCFEHEYEVKVEGGASGKDVALPPYNLQFLDQKARVETVDQDGDTKMDVNSTKGKKKPVLKVIPYKFPEPGPYPEDQPKRNKIQFTGKQVEAVRSGLNHGLTMIVGPPGTGKTDVAVQIMAELFHNNPNQRTLLVTHSNHALNDLFEKIMQRDIDERYLLRMGRGEEELQTEKDFSKFGRVNYMLERRLHCLEEVGRFAKSLGLGDDAGYTCETAAHFYLQYVLARWEVFISQWEKFKKDGTKPPKPQMQQVVEPETKKAGEKAESMEEEEEEEDEKEEEKPPVADVVTPPSNVVLGFVEEYFPFSIFFSNAPKKVFTGNDDVDIEKAWGCWRHLKNLFLELEECRPFEILRNYKDRGNYLISKHAKVIAMTCTHAAIRRGEFVRLNMQYDNLIMEESAQILEIETFIPMLLQEHDKEFGCRLKRVVLLGDHNQLPPIIKNMAFQKYSHMDQSLFSRFIRLGTPHIQLNAQGRSRGSIAKLWNWRYKELGDLPHVAERKEFLKANSGFSYEYQFINVEDLRGKGCTSPMPYFYQNLAEAEYIVQVYMYMRLLGYPASTISILTTYNGQKALLEDIVNQRCRNNSFYGAPARISTVDKYQGQQNDYILLSLVRTKTAGHIRDVRRLVVAMSRARLGLYVFGKEKLYRNCFELANTFNLFQKRPTKLCLNLSELTSLTERSVEKTGKLFKVTDVAHMGSIVSQMAQRAHQNIVQHHYIQQQEEANQKMMEEQEVKKTIEEKKAEYAKMDGQTNATNEEATHEEENQETVVEAAPSGQEEGSSMPGSDITPPGKVPVEKKRNDETTKTTATAAVSEMESPSGEAKKAEKEAPKPMEEDTSTAEAESTQQETKEAEIPKEEEEKEEDEVAEIPDYKSMKFRELQKLCKENGLKASGKKTALIERLLGLHSK